MAQITLNSSGVASSGSLLLQTNGTTTQATVDTSGNLGLGVTPSAWGSGFKAIDVNTYGAVASSTSALRLFANSYNDGTNWTYKTTAAASRYDLSGGAHAWLIAASGTAGNAISFTQAMTLDANGLLQVGATSPINSGAVTFASTSGTYNQLELCDTRAYSSTPNASLGFAVKYNSGGSYTNMAAIVGTKENATDGNYSGALLFYTSLNGPGSAERARIDSSGNLLVGTTAQINAEKFGVVQSGNGQVGYLHATDSSTYTNNVLLLRGNRNTTNATWSFLRCYNNAEKLFIYDSGNVVNANNSYGAISDIKLKENIVDATPKLADLMQVRVRSYNMKNDPDQKHLGVIAQELEEVFPAMIQESPDQDIDGNELGTTTKTVKYSVFVPMLIKALQEQQAIIESLTARITALEQV